MSDEVHLSDEQIDRIAERAADRALEKVYAEVGQTVLRRFLWLVGLVVVSGAIWLARKGGFD